MTVKGAILSAGIYRKPIINEISNRQKTLLEEKNDYEIMFLCTRNTGKNIFKLKKIVIGKIFEAALDDKNISICNIMTINRGSTYTPVKIL